MRILLSVIRYNETISEQRIPPQLILGTLEDISVRICCFRRDHRNDLLPENKVGLPALRIY